MLLSSKVEDPRPEFLQEGILEDKSSLDTALYGETCSFMVSPLGRNETRQMYAITESHLVSAKGRKPQKQNASAIFAVQDRKSGL